MYDNTRQHISEGRNEGSEYESYLHFCLTGNVFTCSEHLESDLINMAQLVDTCGKVRHIFFEVPLQQASAEAYCFTADQD